MIKIVYCGISDPGIEILAILIEKILKELKNTKLY